MSRAGFALVLLLMAAGVLAAGQAVKVSEPSTELRYAKQMQPFATWMVGEWDVVGRLDPSPLFAKGGKETGKLIGKLGPGGASILFDYNGHGPAGPLKGQGSITYDPGKSEYLLSWCDATGCGPVGVGEWDYDYVVFTGERQLAGKKVQVKWMFGNIGTGSYSVNVALTDDNGSVKPIEVVTYTRPDAPKSRRPADQGN